MASGMAPQDGPEPQLEPLEETSTRSRRQVHIQVTPGVYFRVIDLSSIKIGPSILRISTVEKHLGNHRTSTKLNSPENAISPLLSDP